MTTVERERGFKIALAFHRASLDERPVGYAVWEDWCEENQLQWGVPITGGLTDRIEIWREARDQARCIDKEARP